MMSQREQVPSHRVDIIVPVLREEKIIKEYYKAVAQFVKSDWRLLVVYDLPDDPTFFLAQSIAKKDPRVIPVFNKRGGLSAAVKTGLKRATAQAIMVTAVDLFEDVKKLDEMLTLFYGGGYTIVAPSRYMKGGTRNSGMFIHRIFSRLAGVSLFYLTGLPIHDATNGSKLYRKSFLDSIVIESTTGWTIALEITVKAYGAGEPMVEIPITHPERRGGKSKFKLFTWLPQYLYWYLFALKNNFKVSISRKGI